MEGDPEDLYKLSYDKLPEFAHESLGRLISAEDYFTVPASYLEDENLRCLRKYAVSYIEKQSKSENFDALIPYVAMTYFDRFMALGEIPPVVRTQLANVNLCLISCLTLAWKLRTKTFVLAEFLNEKGLNRFSAKEVLQMEFYICRRLDWRMRALTPFSFVEYIIPVLPLRRESPSLRRPVRQLIVKSQFDMSFTKYRPSVVAASAALTVASHMFPSTCGLIALTILTPEYIFPQVEKVLECRDKLELLFEGLSTPEAGNASSNIEDKQPADTQSNIEEARIHRAGKEPAGSAIQPEPEESDELANADDDKLMNFELGWIEAEAAAERKAAAQAADNAGYIARLRQKLSGCGRRVMQSCNILCSPLLLTYIHRAS
ncbi:UNVERIFIED_CONTAM: putative cyclin-D6-1 [Sesamum calycinum]|uniref:Cyclin-D6-1 n=1 Tax=Sesamum calycinum TaxID=2727403 RepID=A0AAW2Q4D3_9LAMI